MPTTLITIELGQAPPATVKDYVRAVAKREGGRATQVLALPSGVQFELELSSTADANEALATAERVRAGVRAMVEQSHALSVGGLGLVGLVEGASPQVLLDLVDPMIDLARRAQGGGAGPADEDAAHALRVAYEEWFSRAVVFIDTEADSERFYAAYSGRDGPIGVSFRSIKKFVAEPTELNPLRIFGFLGGDRVGGMVRRYINPYRRDFAGPLREQALLLRKALAGPVNSRAPDGQVSDELARWIIASVFRNFSAAHYALCDGRRTSKAKFQLEDEYDFQDAVQFALRAVFARVEPEVYTEPVSGIQTRIDVRLPDYRIIVELKYFKKGNGYKKFIRQLQQDITAFCVDSQYDTLYIALYDKDGTWPDVMHLKDLEGEHSHNGQSLDVHTFLVR